MESFHRGLFDIIDRCPPVTKSRFAAGRHAGEPRIQALPEWAAVSGRPAATCLPGARIDPHRMEKYSGVILLLARSRRGASLVCTWLSATAVCPFRSRRLCSAAQIRAGICEIFVRVHHRNSTVPAAYATRPRRYLKELNG
jgi:hypothetical protein